MVKVARSKDLQSACANVCASVNALNLLVLRSGSYYCLNVCVGNVAGGSGSGYVDRSEVEEEVERRRG